MRSLLTTAALLLAPLAHAQVFSVYGTYSPTRLSNVATGTLSTLTPPSTYTYQEEYTSYWGRGFGGGVTFGVLPIGPIRVGLDLRGSTKPGTAGYDMGMGGLKVGLKLPILSLKPYVQGSVGYLGTRTTNISSGANTSGAGSTFSNQYLAYEFLGGIDYPIIPFIDFRLFEIGGGQGINVTGGSNVNILTVSTGAVFHF